MQTNSEEEILVIENEGGVIMFDDDQINNNIEQSVSQPSIEAVKQPELEQPIEYEQEVQQPQPTQQTQIIVQEAPANQIQNVSPQINEQYEMLHSQFSENMENVKSSVLAEARESDEKFVNTIKSNVKSAAVKYTEAEQSRADFTKQKIDYESEKLETLQQKNEHEALEDKWANRQKRRQYHYDGVKPIMESVGIKDPMNLIFLYILAIIITPVFIVGKFLKATIGVIIAGASDGDRPRAARGFLWTLLCVVVVLCLVVLLVLLLKTQGIDILARFKE